MLVVWIFVSESEVINSKYITSVNYRLSKPTEGSEEFLVTLLINITMDTRIGFEYTDRMGKDDVDRMRLPKIHTIFKKDFSQFIVDRLEADLSADIKREIDTRIQELDDHKKNIAFTALLISSQYPWHEKGLSEHETELRYKQIQKFFVFKEKWKKFSKITIRQICKEIYSESDKIFKTVISEMSQAEDEKENKPLNFYSRFP